MFLVKLEIFAQEIKLKKKITKYCERHALGAMETTCHRNDKIDLFSIVPEYFVETYFTLVQRQPTEKKAGCLKFFPETLWLYRFSPRKLLFGKLMVFLIDRQGLEHFTLEHFAKFTTFIRFFNRTWIKLSV